MEKAFIIARANAIADFADNLVAATCDGTRRDAVIFLSRKIGADDAKRIAEAFGLRSAFYFDYSA
ncbi:TPA: hypothetical protein QDB28_004072 [Burkholderia vietnamiensis]|nr:hypothetical protein [Burkholderia vietnamiensis]